MDRLGLNTGKDTKFKLNIKAERKKIEIQHGQLIRNKQKIMYFMIVYFGVRIISMTGTMKNQFKQIKIKVG